MDNSYISYNALPSLELGEDFPEPGSDLPLFNLEKQGDPRIKWHMYYDFVVTKSEVHFEFQSRYIPTEQYPQRLKSDRVTFNGKKRHPCHVPGCNSGPFTRHADLERHFRTVQHFYCDYPKRSHKKPFRKDHFRDHYREHHKEDLTKRRWHTSRTRNEETMEEFLASRHVRDFSWGRCSKCIQRVQGGDYEYVCPRCNISCEQERIGWRKSKSSLFTRDSQAIDSASTFSQPRHPISGFSLDPMVHNGMRLMPKRMGP